MIKILVGSTIKEGCMQEALSIYNILVQETRKEDGCISYELFKDLNDSNRIMLIEEWEGHEHLEKHTQTDHFSIAMNQLSEIEKEEPVRVLSQIL